MSYRKQHHTEFKTTVRWKPALLEGASGLFERGSRKAAEVDEEQVKDLQAKIGELAVARTCQIRFGASTSPICL